MANFSWKFRFLNGLPAYFPTKKLQKWILFAACVAVIYMCFLLQRIVFSHNKPKDFGLYYKEHHSVAKSKEIACPSASHGFSSLLSPTRTSFLHQMVVASVTTPLPSRISTLSSITVTFWPEISPSRTLNLLANMATSSISTSSFQRLRTVRSKHGTFWPTTSLLKRPMFRSASGVTSTFTASSTAVKRIFTTTKPSLLATSSQKAKHQFSLVLPHIEPKLSDQERNLFVAVVVSTAAAGFHHLMLRETIRQTWGKWIVTIPKYAWKVFFSLGIPTEELDKEANLQEARDKNDIIIGSFTDTYRNLPTKTLMSHYWAVTKLSCKYVLKTDDDVYVRVPRLIGWLVKSGSPQSFYGGYVSPHYQVPRNLKSKWYISPEQYNKSSWPPFCHGAFHVLSSDIIPRYLNYARIRKPFHADDAYIGVASHELGINATQIPGFKLEFNKPKRKRTFGELISSLALGHKLDSETMYEYYYFYKIYRKVYDTILSPTDFLVS